MVSDYTVKLRRAIQNLKSITEVDIESLETLGNALLKKVQDLIHKDTTIGKQYLDSLLNELSSESGYSESKIRIRLEELSEIGLSEYDALYSNTKEVIHSLDGMIYNLLNLAKTYYPEIVEKYQISSPIKYSPDLTNTELFLAKLPPPNNTANNNRFRSIHELAQLIQKYATHHYNKEIAKIKEELKAFPNQCNSIVDRELRISNEEFRLITHNYLIVDEVLRKPEEFELELQHLADSINHFSSEELTEIIQLTIKRITLLLKIDFLNSLKTDTTRTFSKVSFTNFDKLQETFDDSINQLYIFGLFLEKGDENLSYDIEKIGFVFSDNFILLSNKFNTEFREVFVSNVNDKEVLKKYTADLYFELSKVRIFIENIITCYADNFGYKYNKENNFLKYAEAWKSSVQSHLKLIRKHSNEYNIKLDPNVSLDDYNIDGDYIGSNGSLATSNPGKEVSKTSAVAMLSARLKTEGLTERENVLVHCYREEPPISYGQPGYADFLNYSRPSDRIRYPNDSIKKAKSFIKSIEKTLPYLGIAQRKQAESEINTIKANFPDQL